MNELKFDTLETYMAACMMLVEKGAAFKGWQDCGYFLIEITGY